MVVTGQLVRGLGRSQALYAFQPKTLQHLSTYRRSVFHHRLQAQTQRCLSKRGPNQKSYVVYASQEDTPHQTATVNKPEDKGSHAPAELPSGELIYKRPSQFQRTLTSLRLFFALPWRRFKKGSVLVIDLNGDIAEQKGGRFAPPLSIPQIKEALTKAAYDPRIRGIHVKVGSVSAGWARLQELRRALDFFNMSGKFSIATMSRGGEKEYFVCSACQEFYIPPTANLTLKGFAVGGTFLKGVLEKVGVEPQVKRIGKYKSAGDQLLRRDMSEAQREQLTALLEDIFQGFTTTIAKDRNKTPEQVKEMLDAGIFDMQQYADGGWVTGLKYDDEVLNDLRKRTGGRPDKLRAVSLKRYAKVSPKAFGLSGKKIIAIVRSSGIIVGGEGSVGSTGSVITAQGLIKQLQGLARDKSVAAVVLRIDSGGGDALASDLMWREIKKLAEKKPIIASMGDVAASGGYYMAMGASKIIAEALTITGSIGVVTGKFNLEELYRRVQYNKVIISRGKYAELNGDNRSFTAEEEDLFDRSAEFAYASFRDKAAESRGLPKEELQKHAQGRVWSGQRALQNGLVDALGGIDRAITIAKQAAGIDLDKHVRLLEVSKATNSPFGLLSQLTLAGLLQTASQVMQGGKVSLDGLAAALLAQKLQQTALHNGITQNGAVMAIMPDIQVEGVGSVAAAQANNSAKASDEADLLTLLQTIL